MVKSMSRGKGIMVSKFLYAAGGRPSCYDGESAEPVHATEAINVEDGGWWNSEKMVEQTKKPLRFLTRLFQTTLQPSPLINPADMRARHKTLWSLTE